ncbi:hypothetical protein CTAYLR_002880 [Chrysophaeum taylorii]|uniref:3'-5' exonuclease n=1 Tax=Chrysophaeum taylorii TaxID=2483200 RepID=A0AAD7U834_9STRA|nr:hypothetical protein CTAYLR_002880 [Chrysophaeum taylorii]
MFASARRWISNQVERKLRKMGRLHPAAKAKRILSYCDFWFSRANLVDDFFLLRELAQHDGWCRVATLATFPRLKHWGTVEVIEAAFRSPGAERYEFRDGKVRHRKFSRVHAPGPLSREPDWAELATLDDLRAANDAVGRSRNVSDRAALVESIRAGYAANPFAFLGVLEAARALASDKQPENNKKKDYSHLPLFEHAAEIRVARKPGQVQRLANDLSTHSVFGFDVELASLDVDLRMLPAMVQLATPSLVGIFWLDKLEHHGAAALAPDQPLGALLADPARLKVGVSASADVESLRKLAPRVQVNNVVDLPGPLADRCALLLERHLPKRKFRGPKNSKRAKLSHWRAPSLTPEMRAYAADDAAASLALWTHTQNLSSRAAGTLCR